MPFAEINGQRIRFEDSGGDGPPVVLAHGFLMDREMFVAAGASARAGVPRDHVGRARLRRDGVRR